MMIALYVVLIIVMVYFIGFFASSETAFVSLNRIQIRTAVQEKKKHAKLIKKMHGKMDKLLSSILIGTNLVTTFTSSLATALTVKLFDPKYTAVGTIIMTVVIIIFGEIMPKTIASASPLEVAQKRSILLRCFDVVLTPVTLIFEGLTKLVDLAAGLFHGKNKKQLITEEELKTLIDMGNSEGTLEQSEKHILSNIVEFGDLRVRDIMKPKQLVIAVNDEYVYDQILDIFALSGYSRLPVYHGSLDNIIGVLSFKDMFEEKNFNIKKVIRSVCYVPETISAISVLKYMKKERQNIAIVVDEHGINCGLITMDDILCSVLGRTMHAFDDETGNPLNRVRILKSNQFVVPGELKLDELNSAFSINLESDYFDTLGGYLLEQFGSLPSVGEVIKRNGIIFEIEDQAQRRIKSVKMTLK